MHERAMEAEILDAVARLRQRTRRLDSAALSEELELVHGLQRAILARPTAWETVRARVGAAAAWWVLQLALAVASSGLPGPARAVLTALPGLPGQADHMALLDGLIGEPGQPLVGVA